MRLKLYQAPNIGAAMAMIRTELGPDALIVATRATEHGIELTAALEPSMQATAPLPNPGRQAMMNGHGIPGELIDELACTDLVTALQHRFSFGQLALHDGAPPILLVGPPGAGK